MTMVRTTAIKPRGKRWLPPLALIGLWVAMVCMPWSVAAQPAGLPGLGAATIVKTDQVTAELLAHAPNGVAPGQALWLALKLDHQPHWHTYWKNPGDSGLPTSMAWTLPPGFATGDIAWPTPKKLPVGPLMNHGYEGTVVLAVPVTVPSDFAAATLPVKLSAQWLVCKEICIPQQGEFSLTVPARASTSTHAGLVTAALANQPAAQGSVQASATVGPDKLTLKLSGMPDAWRGQTLDVLPELPGVLDHAAPSQGVWTQDSWEAVLPLSRERFESPTRMDAVLLRPGAKQGLRISFAVQGAWPSMPQSSVVGTAGAATSTTAATAPPAKAAAPATPAAGMADAGMTWWVAMVSALLGGMLLNLMPCVLPVLSLKVLGFAQNPRGGHSHARVGLAYTAGVIASFLALAGVLLALRAGGEAVGWGFQLQSPWVVAALAALFTLIGLNLAGVFDVGSVVPSSAASLRLKNPTLDAALTGVLAVAIAAPCTAPFMGAALGFAATLPAVQALPVFASLGLGMALPFLAVSLMPGLAAWLPKPGAWMLRFKALMAFPMFATVVWLTWVLGLQVGMDGAAALLAVLVALALAAWGLGQTRWLAALGLASLAAALLWAGPLWQTTTNDTPTATSAASTVNSGTAPNAAWQPWSAAAVANHQAAGRTVFVDFTAAWCVTCQVNKRSTLSNAQVQAAFQQQGVVTMRADWTRRDAAIAAELTRLGRHGVPVYALYRGDTSATTGTGTINSTPELLPELLTPAVVLSALQKR
jgi:thiol:disulfide interchange protein/DsbC/DsbD-like thiol-disulfide interchange protein